MQILSILPYVDINMQNMQSYMQNMQNMQTRFQYAEYALPTLLMALAETAAGRWPDTRGHRGTVLAAA